MPSTLAYHSIVLLDQQLAAAGAAQATRSRVLSGLTPLQPPSTPGRSMPSPTMLSPLCSKTRQYILLQRKEEIPGHPQQAFTGPNRVAMIAVKPPALQGRVTPLCSHRYQRRRPPMPTNLVYSPGLSFTLGAAYAPLPPHTLWRVSLASIVGLYAATTAWRFTPQADAEHGTARVEAEQCRHLWRQRATFVLISVERWATVYCF